MRTNRIVAAALSFMLAVSICPVLARADAGESAALEGAQLSGTGVDSLTQGNPTSVEESGAAQETDAQANVDANRDSNLGDATAQEDVAMTPYAETGSSDDPNGISTPSDTKTGLDIAKATVGAIPDLPYTGKAVEPTLEVELEGKRLVAGTDYDVTYANNVDAGIATATVEAIAPNTGSVSVSYKIVSPTLRYKVHVQTYGDQDWSSDGKAAGTSGESKRLEGIWMELGEGFPLAGGIHYRTHVQTYGWENDWKDSGQRSGTVGESKRLEAIQVELTGDIAQAYDVYYRVHAQHAGWLGWAKNGENAGTAGMSWRLEAIQAVLVPKDAEAPQNIDNIESVYSGAFIERPSVTYHTHVQTYGWEEEWRADGAESGTSGESKRLEGLEIKLAGGTLQSGIEYRTHVQTYGWEEDWRADGAMSGTQGESKRLEAMQIRLTGDAENYLDVWYRVHAQTAGWLGWAKNGEEAGTASLSKRLEALQIVVLPKGSPAPGPTDNRYITSMRDLYIKNYLAAAVAIADDNSHGYSQENQWGPDYDCSSLVVTSLKAAGVPVGEATYTGNLCDNLLANGWSSFGFISMAQLQPGDILLTPNNHTEFYMGDGKNVRALPGPQATGDQTGLEIAVVDFNTNGWRGWTYVLRLN